MFSPIEGNLLRFEKIYILPDEITEMFSPLVGNEPTDITNTFPSRPQHLEARFGLPTCAPHARV
jgi:hypothetical protein